MEYVSTAISNFLSRRYGHIAQYEHLFSSFMFPLEEEEIRTDVCF